MKLYVITRRDLPWPVRAVQAIHAAIELVFEKDHAWGSWSIPSVILHGVANEIELQRCLEHLGDKGIAFREPDLDFQLTAVSYMSEMPLIDNLHLI